MCFMLPKPNFVPEKLINVYGILAKDVFADGRFGTCVMQDGNFVTFSYSVVWAAKERMGDEKYRSRCPFARLNNWFAAKTADATQFERDILASEQRYLETIVGHTSPPSDRSTTPSPSEHAPSTDREEKAQVVIPEGQYICLVPIKHNPIFGIVAENVMEKMSSGRCIMVKTLSAELPKVQTLPIVKLQKAIKRMDLTVYQDQCPYAVLDDLLAANKREESFEAPEMVAANYSPTHETSSYVFRDGTYLCFLNKKGNTIYGVLMRDVAQDEECGTCLLGDMTFESYTYQDFSLAVLQRATKRFDQQVYSTQARVIKYMKECR
jgi:hypothetical protein